MSVAETQTAVPKPSLRWFHLTPDRVVIALLAVEVLLWLSERFQLLPWHKGYAVLTAVAVVGAVMLLMLLWLAVAALFRWRFQFSIRSLLVLTVVVAIPCSWLATEMKQARRQSRAVAKIRALHGRLSYDWNRDADGNYLPNAQPPGPVWLRRVLGQDFFQHVDWLCLAMPKITDADLDHLKEMHQLQSLNLAQTQITDAGMEHLKRLGHLRNLDLGRTRISDAAVEHLKGLNQLQMLSLWGTQVTDAGVEHLKGLNQLQELVLGDTRITDAGLKHLRGLSRLHDLDVSGTKVSSKGVKKLQQALPDCGIEY